MSHRQHLTTRRAFITTLGFGGVALYGAWAAYDAAPLPFIWFSGKDARKPSHQAEAALGHVGHDATGAMKPEEFLRRHEEFVARFSRPDGRVVVGQTEVPTSAAHEVQSTTAVNHDMHAEPPARAGYHDTHDIVQHRASDPHQLHPPGRGALAPVVVAPVTIQSAEVYLLAYRFGFTPDDIQVEAGKPYRFRMMASDITHGASLQFGYASRMIRVRPNVVSEQTIIFNRPGSILVYCTVYCGPAHDAMKARILVT